MSNLTKTKELLEVRLVELTEKIGQIDHALREPDNADSEERATENEGDEVLEDMGNAALDEITQINAALQRIDLDTYGECTSCGDDIGKKRLEALPYTPFCVDCATQAES
jgi:DnaK suppressor protein